MIIDSLDHFECYQKLHPLFKEVAKFLKENNLKEMPTGIYPIIGDDLFVNVQMQYGKTPDEAVLEAHRQMIDIQVPISGVETYGFSPLSDLPSVVYDEMNDCALWHDVAPQNFVTCTSDMFVIFFPQDGHAPLISSEQQLKKAVFKVKVQL